MGEWYEENLSGDELTAARKRAERARWRREWQEARAARREEYRRIYPPPAP